MATDRPVRFTFQQIHLNTPAPRTLCCYITNTSTCLYAPRNCTYPAFFRHLSKPLVLTEQDAELQQLIQLAGMSNTATKVSVVSLADHHRVCA